MTFTALRALGTIVHHPATKDFLLKAKPQYNRDYGNCGALRPLARRWIWNALEQTHRQKEEMQEETRTVLISRLLSKATSINSIM